MFIDGNKTKLARDMSTGSGEALATAIDRLYRNPDYRRQLGDAAARGVDERFSEETMVRETIAVYERLLRRRWSDER